MNRNEIQKIIVPGLVIVSVFLLYLFTEFFCAGNCHPFIHGKMPPLYNGLLGLIPTLLILVIFRKVSVKWVRQVAWWYSILFALVVSNGTGGSFISPSRENMAFHLMALLFVITLIYALIMNRRLKRQGL